MDWLYIKSHKTRPQHSPQHSPQHGPQTRSTQTVPPKVAVKTTQCEDDAPPAPIETLTLLLLAYGISVFAMR